VDLLVIFINLILYPVVLGPVLALAAPASDDIEANFGTFAGMMLIILVGRLGGLYLKRFSLQARLSQSDESRFPMYFLIFNVVLTIVAGSAVAVLAQSAFGQLGLVETDSIGRPKESAAAAFVFIPAIIFAVGLEIFLLYRLSRPLTAKEQEKRERGSWIYGPLGEYVADFGLFMYMMVWQAVYYYASDLLMTMPDGRPVPLSMKPISIAFMAVMFAMLYLAPRAVFLIEDRKYLGTWVFIGLVFLTSVARLW
jgi:hypothetical protein